MSLFVWVIIFDLSGLGYPASSYSTAGLALRIIWPHKPHDYVKIETTSGGNTAWDIVKLILLPAAIVVEMELISSHPVNPCCHRGWNGTGSISSTTAAGSSIGLGNTAWDIVKLILLPAAIVVEMELVSSHPVNPCCHRGWNGTGSISSTTAAGSSIGLTIPDALFTVSCTWWWAEEPPETCRAIYRNK